jgi:signal transduction histidine kinase
MSASHSRSLWLRFALSMLVAFIAIGVSLAVVARRQLQRQEEGAATYHAQYVTNALLRYQVTAEDIQDPPSPDSERYRDLRRLVKDRILRPRGTTDLFPVVRVKIWGGDGTVLFADDPRLVGRRFEVEDDLKEALEGEIESEVSHLTSDENVLERGIASKLFETYVPLYLQPGQTSGRAPAAAELYVDYASIEAQVNALYRPLVLTLLVGLGTLYLVLLPISLRVSRTLSGQNATLGNQARWLESLLEKEKDTVARLKEVNRLKDNFVAVASHELRTPLTSIIGYVKTLRRPEFEQNPALREEFLGSVERQADRLVQLVENLLTTSQVEHGQGRVSVSSFTFDDAVHRAVESMGARGRRVDVLVPAGIRLLSDRQPIELVLSNLVDNALKFSPQGGRCVVEASEADGWVEFSVRDQGVGIPPDEIGRIFERFYQVDSSLTRSFGGIGLGLSLVKDLVQLLGGTIQVTSVVGDGATFTVRIPLVHAAAAVEPSMSRSAPNVGNGWGEHGRRRWGRTTSVGRH